MQRCRLKTRRLFVALFLSILAFSCALSQNYERARAAEQKVTVEKLGNPSAEDGLSGRALNVWDLQVFNQKIYLGAGSVADNSGPIKVWAYDPSKKTFVSEYTLHEEAIEHFQVIDNALYIPAADPRGNDSNKYYRKQTDGEWKKFASPAVGLAHVRKIVQLDDKSLLVVGNGRSSQQPPAQPPGAAITRDRGASFQEVEVTGIPPTGNSIFIDFSWFLSAFSFDGKVYAVNSILRDTGGYEGYLTVYDPDTQKLELDLTIDASKFIPVSNIDEEAGKYGLEAIYHIWRTEEFLGNLVYSVKTFSNIDNNNSIQKNYLNSLGLYVKESMDKPPQEIKFAPQAVGEDLLVIDNELYALANQKHDEENFTVSIYKTTTPADLSSWSEVLSFESANRARSFEYLDNTFYFGLGQDYGEAIANSGDIVSYTLP